MDIYIHISTAHPTHNPPRIKIKQYEAAFGLYSGAMGTLRARLLPEASRATVMNQIRLLLNALVVGVYVLRIDS